jgi:hypothetical protein
VKLVRTPRAFRRHDRAVQFRNLEGLAEFDFVIPGRNEVPGVSAMLRVRNEERKIVSCLASIVSVFDEIVLVDNGSTDRTLELSLAFKHAHDERDVIRVFSYPHGIEPCGSRHLATPADSVHSLVYYSNWCQSRCGRAHICKWDADMVLARGEETRFRAFLESLDTSPEALWALPLQTIYRATDGDWYRANGDVNAEMRVTPNRSAVRFHKAEHWEVPRAEIDLPRRTLEPFLAYELKDVAEDEFSHWSTRDFPTPRKQREWRDFNLVKNGDIPADLFTRLGDGADLFAGSSLTRP